MAATTLVCTTLTGTEPLLPGGEKLYQHHARMHAAVLRRLGEQHANLLATPQAMPGEDRITWRSPVQGIARRLATLPPAVRDSVRAECDMLLADIERTADALEGAVGGDLPFVASLLRMAVTRPADDHLFLVGNQPVLACWGCDPAAAGTVLPAAPTVSEMAPASKPVRPTRTEVAPPVPANPAARWLVSANDASVRSTPAMMAPAAARATPVWLGSASLAA